MKINNLTAQNNFLSNII